MSSIKLFIIITLVICPSTVFSKEAEEEDSPKENFACDSAKEFIVALSYLTDEGTLKMEKAEAVTLAQKILGGCDGAAKRFVKVTETLRRTGFSGANAAQIGSEFALATESQTEAFLSIFRKAFLPAGLDLDLLAAINIARSLSYDYLGDPEQALEDFNDIVDFCLSKDYLALPRPKCAEIASDVARLGEKSSLSVIDPFEEGFEFLTKDEEGPRMTTKGALKLLLNLLKVSPMAPENFQKAYSFLSHGSRLNISRDKAISLALNIANKTYWKPQKK